MAILSQQPTPIAGWDLGPDPDPPAHCPDAPEGYQPTPAEEAYDVAFRITRDGESPRWRTGPGDTNEIVLARVMGTHHGREARESRELGYGRGLDAVGDGEPPAGLAPHRAAAYREGFAEGLEERGRIEALCAEYDAYADAEEARERAGDPGAFARGAR